MTLRRQDRTAFAGALLAGYVTVFFALSAGISEFVAEQLTERNRADARDLAQRLAALPADDAALREWLAGEFSTGAYRYLALSGSRHVVFNERRMGPEDEPRSLADGLFPAHFVPGRATVRQDGVDPRTLIVELRPGPAMEQQRSLVGSLAAVLGAGLAVSAVLGAVLVRRDPPPGDEGQGKATAADNGEARPAADPDRDGLTGLLRRGDFLAQLKATLDDDERSHAGCLALLRIEHLAALNHSHGRRVVDAVLASIGQSLRCWIPDHGELISGRLNGSDFAVLAPACDDPARLGTTLRWRIAQTFKRHGFEESLSMPATATHCA
ncbi:MAG: diguanylate cyclase, partial [Halieaceae bacterium]|nr:diguanylate cyclase [Halieaceae bacterium]